MEETANPTLNRDLLVTLEIQRKSNWWTTIPQGCETQRKTAGQVSVAVHLKP